ncbi:MAG TPA: protein kinase [Blastocatellia bacterium]|nr:protein kinase [Blastocatellia bacterium]
MAIEIGSRLGHYKVLAQLGAGGMGEVYIAQDTRLGRKIALKVLSEDVTKNKERVSRFQQEARAASALNHPNIITIHEVGEEESLHFIATELIEGPTLRQRLQQSKMSVAEVLDVGIQVSSALAAAHAHGIMHRDIKPENIMLRPDGYVKVLDFGLAKLTEQLPDNQTQVLDSGSAAAAEADKVTKRLVTTDPGTVMGTVSYMSPEQARGVKMDSRTDIFSLGIVIYEMMAGRTPFEGLTISDVIMEILGREPAPLPRYAPEVPPELERIVTKALAKDREERYQTVKDLAIDLKRLKRRFDVESELSRSSQQDFADKLYVSSSSGAQKTVPVSPDDLARSTDAVIPPARTTSSAEYLITELKRHKKGAAATFAVVIVLVVGLTFFVGGKKPISSVAVLPFDHVDTDADAEYLSDGITESIINSLSRLPNLKVMSFSSVRAYRNQQKTPSAIGRELDVGAVLTGRIVHRGDSVAISIEMVDARDNSHIWGKQFNPKFADINLMQEEIAKDIADSLRLTLSGADRARLEAEELYARGRNLLNKRTTEGLKSAIDYFQQAIEREPNFARAYAGLADCYNMLVVYSALPPKEAFPKAKIAAEKALSIEPTLAEAHTSLAFVKFRWDRDWAGAGEEFERAITLSPGYAPAHQWYANYLAAKGRMEEAVAEAKRTQEADPLSLLTNSHPGFILFMARRYDEAIEQSKKKLELDPDFFVARRYLGMSYLQKGETDKAIAEYREALMRSNGSTLMKAELAHALAVSGDSGEAQKLLDELAGTAKQKYVSPYLFALIYTGMGKEDEAFNWLDKAFEDRADFLVYFKVDPRLENLRNDSRYTSLLQRLGLPQ